MISSDFNGHFNMFTGLPSFEEFLQRDFYIKTILNKNKKDTLDKWSPIIKSQLDDIYLDETQVSNLCFYLEICSHYYTTLSNITNQRYELNGIFEKIRKDIKSSLNNKRSAVVRKVFNYQTGKMEYELEDGKFVEINESVITPKIEFDISVFPKEFIKLVDPEKYRDLKIDEIL